MVDPELIAYFDQRFREQTTTMRQEFASVRQEMTQEFASVRQEMAQEFAAVRGEMAQEFAAVRGEMAQEFAAVRGEMTQQFAEVREEIAEVRAEAAADREENARRFQRLEDTGRQTLVLVEELRSQIALLAEGYGGLNERLERVQGEIALLPGQIKGWIQPILRNLDDRIRILEGRTEPPPSPRA